jgi:hypothetical protein
MAETGILTGMNTLETDIEIAADGSMRLLSPRPDWLKPGRAHVVLTVEDATEDNPRRQIPKATPEMIAKRAQALAELRAMGGLTEVIPDPVAWQKEMREDAKLPGRE